MSSALLRAIFSESPIAIVILTKEGRILSANRSFLNLCRQSSVRDMNLSQLIISEDLDAYSTVFDRMSEGKTDSFSTELRYRSFENSQRWIRMTLYPVEAAKRDIVVGFFEDVTVQKEREAELRRQKENSRKAQEAAEKETRVKSDFLANMSHEIRTPIHTITGMSELLGETKLDPEQQEYVDQIEFSADVLLSLINDVLDFSKIEAGKLSLEKIEFDLQKMAEDAVDLVALEAHKKGLDTGVLVEDDVPTLLLGDPVRLRQIIVNLFNNAVKFTREGEVVITISKEEDYTSSVMLKFCVHDTGIGIPEDKKNKLFKVFSQVDSSTTRKYGGTGLGLSISKNLAELMQGRIGVESREGRGSTFWFTALLEKQGEPDFYTTLPANYFQQRVLVVDDNTRLRGFLRHYLEQWGCRVEECSDGPTALKRLSEANAMGEDFDICLVDLLMPKMDGWQFASEVNSNEALSQTALILMSPTGKSGDEAKMKLLHWYKGYLSKPVKKSRLFEIIFNVLNVEKAGEAELSPIQEEETVELLEELTGGVFLVVEDHEVNQQLFKAILENLGHEVHIANNGLEALKAVKGQSYDLIFMDVQMPEMNGYEATREIRQMGIDTPIIAVTASALRGEEEKTSAAGMNDFLVKPFKKKDLLPLLNRWFEGSGEDALSAAEEHLKDAEEPLQDTEEPLPVLVELPFEAEDPVIDMAETLATFMGKREVVRKVINSFIEKVETQLPRIDAALGQQDFDTLRSEAHAIKGGSLNLEAVRLGKTAAALEQAAVQEDARRASGLSELLNEEYRRFTEKCRSELPAAL